MKFKPGDRVVVLESSIQPTRAGQKATITDSSHIPAMRFDDKNFGVGAEPQRHLEFEAIHNSPLFFALREEESSPS